MNCKSCGKELVEGAKFCAGCGTVADAVPEALTAQVPEWLSGLSGPKDIVGLDVDRLEQLLRMAKSDAERVQALTLVRDKALRKQTFLAKFRKGMQDRNSFSAATDEEKAWSLEFNNVLKNKMTMNYIKRFDEEIAPAVNEELATAAAQVQSAFASSPALQLIPVDYRNSHALSNMASYLANGRASTWAECLDKLEQSGQASSGAAVKCPKCGSPNLQVTTQTDTTGGMDVKKAACGVAFLGPLGLLCGNKKKEEKHTDFWVCGSCGNKFPRESQ